MYPDRLEVSNPGGLPYGFTLDQLTTLHNSQPTNPILTHPVFLAGYIERIGTGTTDIVDDCVAAGLAKPEYKQDGTGFKVIIWRKSKKANEPQTNALESVFERNVPQNKAALRARRVLEFLISQPSISTEEIGIQLGVTSKTVKRTIDSLRGVYSIKWIGPSKSGRWEIGKMK